MVMQSRPGGAITRGLLGVIVAGLVAGLAACGGVVAGSGASHPTAAGGSARPKAALCANTAHLDRLVVSLAGALPQSHFQMALPRGITVRDPAKVRAVASALCGLPPMPHGAIACPADFGGGYRFAFWAGGRQFPPVAVRVTGCRSVSGLGPARQATRAFWNVLRTELGPSRGGAVPTSVPMAP